MSFIIKGKNRYLEADYLKFENGFRYKIDDYRFGI